jgi:hypothetical protein
VAVVSPRDSIWALAALDLFLTNVVQFRPEELNRAFQFVGVTDDRKKQVHLAMMEAGWPV